jgi:hypothetical protein
MLVFVATRVGFAALALARRRVLGAAIVVFSLLGLSALVGSAFTGGWWQNALIEIGAGLLFVGLIDLAVLSALRESIDGNADRSAQLNPDPALTAQLDEMNETVRRIEEKLKMVTSSVPPNPKDS